MDEVSRMLVWSNGKVVRKYVGQDVKHARCPHDVKRTSPEKGYRKMIAVLYETDL